LAILKCLQQKANMQCTFLFSIGAFRESYASSEEPSIFFEIYFDSFCSSSFEVFFVTSSIFKKFGGCLA